MVKKLKNKQKWVKIGKKQRETGRYKNNRQKLARINKNWQNGQSHANV